MRYVILGGEREGWADGGREGKRMYGWMDVVGRKASRKEYVENTSHQKDKVHAKIQKCSSPLSFNNGGNIRLVGEL